MMLPAILVLKFDAARHFVLPLPVFLLWPLIPIGLAILAITGVLIAPRGRLLWLRFALSVVFNLRGLQVNVRSRAGQQIQIDFR